MCIRDRKCTLEYASEHFFGQTMGGPLLSSIFVKQATACHYPCNFVQVLSIDPCKWRKKYTSGARNSTTKHCGKHGLVPSNNKTTAKYTIWCQAVAESARGVNNFFKKAKKTSVHGLTKIFLHGLKKLFFGQISRVQKHTT